MTIPTEIPHFKNRSAIDEFLTIAAEIRYLQNHSALVSLLTIATVRGYFKNHSAIVKFSTIASEIRCWKNQSALVNLLTIATTSRCLQNFSALSPFPVSIRGSNFFDVRDLDMLSAESLALFIFLTIATGIRQLLYEAALVFFIPTESIQFWNFLAPVSCLTLANEMLYLQNQSAVVHFFYNRDRDSPFPELFLACKFSDDRDRDLPFAESFGACYCLTIDTEIRYLQKNSTFFGNPKLNCRVVPHCLLF